MKDLEAIKNLELLLNDSSKYKNIKEILNEVC
jgi:hypothetical protein